MRGRKPKPLALRILQGNPGGRPLGAPAGPFAQGIPEKPSHLDKDASVEWDRLVTTLAEVLSPASRGLLICAADAYSVLVGATRVLKRKGSTYTTRGPSGTLIRQRPEVRMRENARRAYQQALSELGASPVAQIRLQRLPSGQLSEEEESAAEFFP